jgi:transcriptional regulator with XRE-family HTH domain
VQQTLRKQFGQFLREKRGDQTLRDFARKVGVSSSTLQRLEMAEQNVTLDTLERVTRKLKITVSDIFRN